MLLDIVLGSGSVDMYIGETENETGIFQKNLIDAIYSIRKSSKDRVSVAFSKL